MNVRELHNSDLDRAIELYILDRDKLYKLCNFEEFCEQFCHRCDTCGKIISVLDMCEECDVKEEKNEFQEFELNKEKILYNL